MTPSVYKEVVSSRGKKKIRKGGGGSFAGYSFKEGKTAWHFSERGTLRVLTLYFVGNTEGGGGVISQHGGDLSPGRLDAD